MAGGILLGLLVLALIYLIASYNGLVRLKHEVARAWSNIDVLLKQRHDELPKLIEVCKQYQRFEATTLSAVIEARSRVASARERADVRSLGSAEGELRNGLSQLFAVAENYPELKANQQFEQLHQRITSLENGIADRREVYNEAVTANNVRVEQFPDTVVARLFRFDTRPTLQFSAEDRSDVDVKSLFS